MAHHKSAKKAMRQAAKRRTANRYYTKTTRNAVRKLKTSTDKAEAEKQLPEVISMIDKLARRNVIHRNKAANLKSSVMKKVGKM